MQISMIVCINDRLWLVCLSHFNVSKYIPEYI